MCIFERNGLCIARVCFSGQECGAKNTNGFSQYFDKPQEEAKNEEMS